MDDAHLQYPSYHHSVLDSGKMDGGGRGGVSTFVLVVNKTPGGGRLLLAGQGRSAQKNPVRSERRYCTA